MTGIFIHYKKKKGRGKPTGIIMLVVGIRLNRREAKRQQSSIEHTAKTAGWLLKDRSSFLPPPVREALVPDTAKRGEPNRGYYR